MSLYQGKVEVRLQIFYTMLDHQSFPCKKILFDSILLLSHLLLFEDPSADENNNEVRTTAASPDQLHCPEDSTSHTYAELPAATPPSHLQLVSQSIPPEDNVSPVIHLSTFR